MAKTVVITQTLTEVVPKRGSVRFNQDPTDKRPFITSIYGLRDRAKREGVNDLDDVIEVKCTFELVLGKEGKKKKKRDRDEDEDDE